jgi:hypothetical protein
MAQILISPGTRCEMQVPLSDTLSAAAVACTPSRPAARFTSAGNAATPSLTCVYLLEQSGIACKEQGPKPGTNGCAGLRPNVVWSIVQTQGAVNPVQNLGNFDALV